MWLILYQDMYAIYAEIQTKNDTMLPTMHTNLMNETASLFFDY